MKNKFLKIILLAILILVSGSYFFNTPIAHATTTAQCRFIPAISVNNTTGNVTISGIVDLQGTHGLDSDFTQVNLWDSFHGIDAGATAESLTSSTNTSYTVFFPNGTYTAHVEGTATASPGGSGTCSIQQNFTVAVPLPPPPFTVTATAGTGCTIAPVSQSIPNGGIASFHIDADSTHSTNSSIIAGSCTLPGTLTSDTINGGWYYATGAITGNCNVSVGCTPIPPPITGSCSASPNPANINQNVTWTATASGGTGTYSYNWSGTDGLSGTGISVVKSYSTAIPSTKNATVVITSGEQSIQASCSVTIPGINPPPPPGSPTLTVSKTGTGSGTVTSLPAGITCGTGINCSSPFNYGTDVYLTADPSAGSKFIGWGVISGNSSTCTTGTCTVYNITDTTTVPARFELMTGTLTPAPPSSTCTIALGASNCTKTLTWTTAYPIGTSCVTNNDSATPASACGNNSSQSFTIPYNPSGVTFYLYNNAINLAQAVVNTVCTTSPDVTQWDSITGTCKIPTTPTFMSGALTGPASCIILSGSNSCNASLSWGITSPVGVPTAITFFVGSYTVSNSLATSQSGTQFVSVPYNNKTFYLYNNGVQLAWTAVTSSCEDGTDWNTTSQTCEPPTTPINGVCSTNNHYNCSVGTSTNNVDGASAWTWNCNGSNGGTNASCSETKAPGPNGTLSGLDCQIALNASTCTTTLTLDITNPVPGAQTNITKADGIVVASNMTPASKPDIEVDYQSTTFFLNHDGDTLNSKTINATCSSGIWNGTICASSVPVNDASCTSITAPSSVVAGQPFSASVKMKNTGSKIWYNENNNNPYPHRLGTQSPQDTTRWAPLPNGHVNRVVLPSTTVAPGSSATFNFTATAPSFVGAYNFDWKMVEEGQEWFGATCTTIINVTAAPSLPDLIVVDGSVAPTSATVNVPTGFTAVVKNIGNASTGRDFPVFLQRATAADGGGTRTSLLAQMKGPLEAGGSLIYTSQAYNFPSTGIYSVMVCADKSSPSDAGVINEGTSGGEGNNCSPWINVNVTNAPVIPTVTTKNSCTSITQNSAINGGTTVSNGGATVTQAGLVWSTLSNPTTSTNTGITYDGWAINGPWSSNMSGLTANTLYHIRAYATNSVGTAYGSDVTCTTLGMSGTMSANSNPCSIPLNGNSCTTTLTWNVNNPEVVGGSAVTSNTNDSGAPANVTIAPPVSTGTTDSGTKSNVTIPYNSRTFYLYNNAKKLAQVDVAANCVAGTGWNGTICAKTYIVTGTAGAKGTISPPTQSSFGGEKKTLIVTPNPGYTASASGCFGGSLSGTTFTTGPITANCTVTATFSIGGGGPNLTASAISPATATGGVAQTYSATITNIGNVDTGPASGPGAKPFPYFFQTATLPNGGGAIQDLTPAGSINRLIAGQNINVDTSTVSPPVNFPTGATPSIRVCADKSSSKGGGVITETPQPPAEDDNCGDWTNVTVCASGDPCKSSYPILSVGSIDLSNYVIASLQKDSKISRLKRAQESAINVLGKFISTAYASGAVLTGLPTRLSTPVTNSGALTNLTFTNKYFIDIGNVNDLTQPIAGSDEGWDTYLIPVNGIGGNSTTINSIQLIPGGFPVGPVGIIFCADWGNGTTGDVSNPAESSLSRCTNKLIGDILPNDNNMSGTLTPSSPFCTISLGASSCNINFSWNTLNPVGVSSVTKPVNVTVANGNSGNNVPFAVKFNSETFYLYNNAIPLAQSTVLSVCESGSVWDGSGVCVEAPPIDVPVCGDGQVTPPEQCDYGGQPFNGCDPVSCTFIITGGGTCNAKHTDPCFLGSPSVITNNTSKWTWTCGSGPDAAQCLEFKKAPKFIEN